MIEDIPRSERSGRMLAAGLPQTEVRSFLADLESQQLGPGSGDASAMRAAGERLGRICLQGRDLLERLPARSRRDAKEKAAGRTIVHLLAAATWRFFRTFRIPAYDTLTAGRSRALRLEDLAEQAAVLFPGVMPSRAELARESQSVQADKDGLEIHQGLFFGQLLSDREVGLHLCHSMLRPLPEALERLPEFMRSGVLDLGTVRVQAEAEAGYLYFQNTRYLNAEDDDSLGAQELACDLILLHPVLRVGVLRGAAVPHPKYGGRRVFSAGINLTRIYRGRQSYLFYLLRDMGLLNKLYRGITTQDIAAEVRADEPEQTLEKPWLAVVDTFAIGGGCQLLLVMDYVIAESGAYFNLPARKEGIIPGCANLRLPRFMGERLARQAIMFDRTFPVDSPEARTLVNEVHPREDLDRAVEECIANAVGSGMVSAAGNRKAIRVQGEPLDTFRLYMATYAYEQAFCHLSEQLVHNLERYWNAKERRL